MAEQEQAKYTYKYSLTLGRIGATADPEKVEPEKSELQAYINAILGLEGKREDKNLPY